MAAARSLLAAAVPAALELGQGLCGISWPSWDGPCSRNSPSAPDPCTPISIGGTLFAGECCAWQPLVPAELLSLWKGWVGTDFASLLCGSDTSLTNPPPISHLSRALRCILRFQEQLRHFLGSTVLPAEQNTLTLCLLDIRLLHPLMMAMYSTVELGGQSQPWLGQLQGSDWLLGLDCNSMSPACPASVIQDVPASFPA